jgi:putative ABC transport system substrate-binding protein
MPLFLARLAQLGYVEGKNLTVESATAGGQAERLAPLATQLVSRQPDVLVAGFGTLTTKALKDASSTIPIVFVTVGDPVSSGVVASLGRPGGNVTGLTDQATDAGGKRLALLQEATGGKKSFAVLGNPDTPFFALAVKEIEQAAAAHQVRLKVVPARSTEDIGNAFDGLADGEVAGLIVLGDPVTIAARGLIVERANQRKLPTMFQFNDPVQAGGLMSYGADRKQSYVRAADYVDLILKGRKPSDLPVEQPTKFQLVVNLKTAKALGLALPPTILSAADEVIE